MNLLQQLTTILMRLTVIRYSDNTESTLGLLFIDDKFESYTLEDGFRFAKIKGETRIPNGEYKIELRKEGGFHNRYKSKYSFHQGMLHVKYVPGYEYILIHSGNTSDHTAGCLLIGDTANDNTKDKGFIGKSRDAYKDLYIKVVNAISNNERVIIEYKDIKQ